jgi:hypothetical protein
VASYRILTGVEFGNPSKRYEVGDVANDIPAKSVSWLVEQGIIELSDGSNKSKKSEPVVIEEPAVEEAI